MPSGTQMKDAYDTAIHLHNLHYRKLSRTMACLWQVSAIFKLTHNCIQIYNAFYIRYFYYWWIDILLVCFCVEWLFTALTAVTCLMEFCINTSNYQTEYELTHLWQSFCPGLNSWKVCWETGFIARNRNLKTGCHLAARKQPFKLFQETLYTGDIT